MSLLPAVRQVVGSLVLAALAAAVAGGVWSAATGEGFRVRFALSLMVVAGLLALAGGTLVPRMATAELHAFLGRGPGNEEPGDQGEALTPLGVFLFVALPLFAAGLVAYGSG
ncbi:hypothetical protein QOZ88_14130 [Blastococcus sp. BMG 814]|uniref:Uncharacterized protein n=1 Tax=Blastococcus carthaginiensis TaxID=3050034 RepID=A0ABT9IDW2_9ACTN|nr:hypothetical protein [Blastococcus carthaginiensis]MDP5183773.1 hypothetical protein [Blastococcus carthaginiensis]